MSYCRSVLDRDSLTEALEVDRSCSIDYKNYTLSELYALTSNSTYSTSYTRIILHLYLIYMQICETLLNKK